MQPGRFLNDFRYLGFNQAENGKQVFDGMMQWIAAGDGISMNYRWSQPGRTERNRQDHLFVRRPLSVCECRDDGSDHGQDRQPLCQVRGDPHVSICHGNLFRERVLGEGRVVDDDRSDGHEDLPTRLSRGSISCPAMQHGTGNARRRATASSFRIPSIRRRCSERCSRRWINGSTAGTAATEPGSKLSDGTLVRAVRYSTGFPRIPGVTYLGFKTTRYLLNYGPDFYRTGIPTINPPTFTPPFKDDPANGPIYPSFVPKTDSGRERYRGYSPARSQVPLATYTGWALRAAPHNERWLRRVGSIHSVSERQKWIGLQTVIPVYPSKNVTATSDLLLHLAKRRWFTPPARTCLLPFRCGGGAQQNNQRPPQQQYSFQKQGRIQKEELRSQKYSVGFDFDEHLGDDQTANSTMPSLVECPEDFAVARPTLSQSSMSTTYIRVRTTSGERRAGLAALLRCFASSAPSAHRHRRRRRSRHSVGRRRAGDPDGLAETDRA